MALWLSADIRILSHLSGTLFESYYSPFVCVTAQPSPSPPVRASIRRRVLWLRAPPPSPFPPREARTEHVKIKWPRPKMWPETVSSLTFLHWFRGLAQMKTAESCVGLVLCSFFYILGKSEVEGIFRYCSFWICGARVLKELIHSAIRFISWPFLYSLIIPSKALN